MPANLWFYEQLVNMEIKTIKPTSKNLETAFMQYLHRKYAITKQDLKRHTIFEVVGEREQNPDFIELYGDIWNKAQEMKHSPSTEVIAYIKSIKVYFNKENVSAWVQIQKAKRENCNDC